VDSASSSCRKNFYWWILLGAKAMLSTPEERQSTIETNSTSKIRRVKGGLATETLSKLRLIIVAQIHDAKPVIAPTTIENGQSFKFTLNLCMSTCSPEREDKQINKHRKLIHVIGLSSILSHRDRKG
jgi:hypothetical protein